MPHTYDIDSCDSNNNSGVRAKSTLAKKLKTIKWIYQGQKTFLGVNWAFTIPRTRILNSWIWRPNTGVSLTEEQKIYNSRQSGVVALSKMHLEFWLLSVCASVENVEKYVLACLSLYNYLRQTDNTSYTPTEFLFSVWLDTNGN